ncbi:MAG: tetratricopeptide repeat protein [Deltaproteobacteria bacterium]|nr:MAG: tetratricopeptide repeat protein [Deltaproteobacteria bacterium]
MPNELSPPSSTRIGDEGPSDRLDSWKDIAAYLKRDVSTVQRWEKRERMPVHRHVHDRLGTVYGFRPELDAWWRSRGSSLAQQQARTVETTATPATLETGEDSQPHVPLDPGDHANPGRVQWARRWLVLAGLVALGLVVTIAYVSPFDRAGDRTKPEIGSLAVLPLENLSHDPTQEYVADGMTEALITELGKIGSLRVIARTSVMKYKGTHTLPSKVARELGVQALVAGSVLRSGDRLRITAQLIDPNSDRPTWSEVHERELRDVLTLQREVTMAIAGQVRARLTAPEQAHLGKLRPVNPEAYESVLRVTPEETGELEQKAFAAAEKALSLDPDLPEAYLARGDLLWTHSHHFAHERAAQEFRRALSLNPNSDGAHRRLARVYVHVGFFEEALQHAAIALAINPSNAQALNSRAQALLWMGKDEEALATFLSIPGPVLPELVEANTVFTLLRLGRREEASLQLKTALRKYPNDKGGNLAGIEAMLLAESEPVKAAAFIETVARRKAVNPAHHAAYFAACASARMRRAKEAVDWLREAAETGFPCYALFARDANLDPIRADPIFQGFMADLQKRSAFLRKAMFPDRK